MNNIYNSDNSRSLINNLFSFIHVIHDINQYLEPSMRYFTNINLEQFNIDTITEYDINLIIQQLMGGDVKVNIRNIDKVIKNMDYYTIKKDDTCIICMENLLNMYDTKIPIITLCNHAFCRECITKWFNISKKCPICNSDQDELFKNIKINEEIDIDAIINGTAF